MSVHGKKQKKRQNSYVKATESGRKMMLKGKIAVVTGASRGIGRAIAVKLAAEGAVVIINYNRSKDEAEKVKEQIEASGGQVKLIQCNVASFESCEKMFEEVMKEFGRIDILVNNAGITKDGLLMKMSEDDFDAVVDTNLKGAFHCIRFVSRAMIRQRSGRIINISSVSGVLGNAGQANYAASKAGVIGLTKSAANYSKCSRARIYPDGNDSGSFGKSERKGSSANSDGAIRRGGRCGAGCCVSCIRAGRIHYRAGALRRRRHGDVIIIAPLEKEEV